MSLKGRFKVTDADKKYNTEAWKRYQSGNPAYIKASKKKSNGHIVNDVNA